MNIFNKTIFSLLFSLSIPAFGMQNALAITVPSFGIKNVLAIGASRLIETGKSLGEISSVILPVLAINSALTYISTCAQLYGHGIASRDPNYKVTIPSPTNLSQLLTPVGYATWDCPNKTYIIPSYIAGPLAGTIISCSQIAGLEKIHRSIGKSPSWANDVLATLKTIRVGLAISRMTEGFLPTYFNENDGNGNGHKIWKWLTGNNNFPAICDKYYLLSLAIVLLSLYTSLKLNLIYIN